jgi:acetolactate decarboxylase
VFEFHQAEGTIVGFWCPEYVKKVNVPGYHFHFISKDKKRGGHVLDFIITNSTIDIDEKTSLDVVLPETEDFYMIDTSEESQNLAEK